jgi:diguanylate cyclase (GGDEF)-like protein/PAS domain S-box-containing protein
MQVFLHLTPHELAALGYTDLSHINETDEFRLYRATTPDGQAVLIKIPTSSIHSVQRIRQLEHEIEISGDLNPEYVVRAIKLERRANLTAVILEDCSYPPLTELLNAPLQVEPFLVLASGITAVLAEIHKQGWLHKDIKPANIFTTTEGKAKLGGFGFASRLPREHQGLTPLEEMAGTLGYMAPEQTGRMNRSIDARSDLYSLGIVFYQMLTGQLPFTAVEPIEWVHCHITCQPKPPQECQKTIPAQLSNIVMKLLAKAAEDRYQTARGLQADLEQCLDEWQERESLEPFELGRSDIADHLMISEKLYGRNREVKKLIDGFDRVVHSGKTELMLVSGDSGIGKSMLVNELQKAIISSCALFTEGKCQPCNRETPYVTLALALKALVRQILGKGEEEGVQWRDTLRDAVGANGRLVTDLVPDLIPLIGEQPPVADVPPQDAQNRFRAVIRNLINTLSRPEHPLILFLDDLQWLDAATLDLLEYLLIHPSVKYLLLLGAYHDNEVDLTHSLRRTIEVIHQSSTRLSEIALAPLEIEACCKLIADSMHNDPKRAHPLARLVYEKAGGNPFFAIQFLITLADQNLLVLDIGTGEWHWDLTRIHAKGFPENIVDLIAARLGCLSNTTQEALKQLAFLGTTVEIDTLTTVFSQSEEALHSALWEAEQAGLVLRSEYGYQFLHDHVQEAAYSLVPEALRHPLHLVLGRMLFAQYPHEAVVEKVFDIIEQYNRGIGLITQAEERNSLRRLNALAGRRAYKAVAYTLARSYLERAATLLPEDTWNQCYAESLELFLELAECEYLVGNLTRAEDLLNLASEHVCAKLDLISVHRLRLRLYQTQGRFDEALEVALQALGLFGLTLLGAGEDSKEATEAEHKLVSDNLHGRRIHDLLHASMADDAETHVLIGLLIDVGPLIYLMRPDIYPLFTAKAVNICLQRGHGNESSLLYSNYAQALAADTSNTSTAQQFSELAIELNKNTPGAGPVRGKVLSHHAVSIMIWRHHFAKCLPFLERAFQTCIDFGDLVYAAYTMEHTPWLHLESGEPLDHLLENTGRYIAFAEENHEDTLYHIVKLQQQFTLAMQGKTRSLVEFSDASFDEKQSVAIIEQTGIKMGIALYNIYKQMAAFIAGQYKEALVWAERAAPLLAYVPGCSYESTHSFYYALTLTVLYEQSTTEKQQQYARKIEAISDKLKRLVDVCPENFANRYLLLSAETARLEKRDQDVVRLYEAAISSARKHGFVQNEAVAHEMMASYYQQQDIENVANVHLAEALTCFTRWGANGKVRQLQNRHQCLEQDIQLSSGVLVSQVDVVLLIEALQTLSGDVELPKLIQALMTLSLESGGADRGLLFLARDQSFEVEVEAIVSGMNIQVSQIHSTIDKLACSHSIINKVIKTRKSVVVEDDSHPREFFEDPDLHVGKARSVLCLPLLREDNLSGLLYLESRQSSGVFTSDRIAVLDALATQAAISLDNAHLYSDLRESEERFRLVFENSPVPIQEEDYSEVKARLEALSPDFGDDLEGYLAEHPGTVQECAALVRMIEVNHAALLLHDAKNKEVMLHGLPQLFIPETIESFRDVLVALMNGETHFHLELKLQTITGRKHHINAYLTVCPGYEQSLGRVLVSLIDISGLKQVEQERQRHLHFLESLDRVNRAIQGAADLEQMMTDVLEVVLEVFACDRAYLQYPCDPDASEWWIPMERCSPEHPSTLAPGQRIPMDDHISHTLRGLLDASGPLRIGPGTNRPIPPETTAKLGVRSLMAVALRPKVDRPWQFGVHQCSHDRVWTVAEERLLQEIGRRLSDGLNSLLTTHNLRESEERFRLVFENSPVSIWEGDFSALKPRLKALHSVHGEDLESYLVEHPEIIRECAALVRVVNINEAVLELHDAHSKEEMFADLPQTFIPESYDAFRKELVAISRGKTELLFDSSVQTLCGKRREVTVYFSVCPGYEQSLSKVFVSLVNITERKHAEERLRLAASVFATSQEGILISDAKNRIIDINPAFTRLTGYTREETLGRNPGFLSAGRQSREFYDEMWRSINTKGEWQGELWNRRKSGGIYPEQLSIVAVRDEQNQLQHYVGAFTDISQLKQHEEDLDRIAHYDVLTSIPNRRLLDDRLTHAIAHARRQSKNLAVCYLDLDGFKPINDQFGHESGDHMLIEIARRLESMSRAEDTVARLGGDEFVLLWNDIGDKSDCVRALERILDKVSEPMLLNGELVSVSASIGVTLFPDDQVDADSLLRHADHAMYTAKQLGKNRYQIFDALLERQISARANLLSMVALGLDRKEFELYYQPKVDYVAGRVVGTEALLRWNDPVFGMISPKDFLPLIENDSLAISMGRWVMEQAVRQAKVWHDLGIQVPISVNVFPRHLKYLTFIDDLRKAIAHHWPQIPKNRLLMEIVESVDLEELEPIEQLIEECLRMGIGFSLDDFGTGYSSLVYLRRLSIEELKIDLSFVRDMLEDPDDEAIVVSVIRLGQAFGLRVVAEGVETTQQAHYLVELGCSVVQGYGMGRPMPANAFQKWYAEFKSKNLKYTTHGG